MMDSNKGGFLLNNDFDGGFGRPDFEEDGCGSLIEGEHDIDDMMIMDEEEEEVVTGQRVGGPFEEEGKEEGGRALNLIVYDQ